MIVRLIMLIVAGLVIYWPSASRAGEDIKIGSKAFTESVILGEVLAHLARETGVSVHHHRQLGGTRVLWDALLAGEIDIYPEYTGTITNEILSGDGLVNEKDIRTALEKYGLAMTAPIGFNNTYAIGMLEETANRLGITKISDLRGNPELSFGFGNEFLDRGDGWPSLRAHYALPQRKVTGLDHDLAYRGLVSGSIDAMDVYTTDAAIMFYGLRILEDDLRHFPTYNAVLLYRVGGRENDVSVADFAHKLEGRIDESTMTRMNARVKLDGYSETLVAADFVADAFNIVVKVDDISWLAALWKNTCQHLKLVSISLTAALLFALPLGIVAARHPKLGQIILASVGIIQTVPSLALFVFMIPLVGIGGPPAMLALFLYSLLPVVRNTHAGLTGIAPDILEAAHALGLPAAARLRLVEIPMAGGTILAGIKTSAVINVGTATLGALIGAGGYGQPILTGIRLDDVGLILSGAIPAALLALLVQGIFETAERFIVPKGLRL